MTSIFIGLLLALPLLGAEPAGYRYLGEAELKSFAKPGASKTVGKTSVKNLAGFGVNHGVAVHREASGVAELHKTRADLMVIVSGDAELVVGGTMPGSKTTTLGEVRAPSIHGGVRQKLSPGDIVHVPPKTPHQFLLDPGAQITYFVLKIKE